MKVMVTGSAGHLGEALIRTLQTLDYEIVGVDLLASPTTTHVGSITDRNFVRSLLQGVEIIFHTAALHKPHVETHRLQAFVDTNITGTLTLLEEGAAAGIRAFIFTSTTSVFGDALVPPPGAPAAWITEAVRPVPKNIYGVTKTAAEDLCQLFWRNYRLPCIVLRTSRFFPEEDDSPEAREMFADDNLKVNEYLFRRVDIEDAVSAHLAAAERASAIGFGTYIISATTPFSAEDVVDLRRDAPGVVRRLFPGYETLYQSRGWKMHPEIGRVYVNARAREELGWRPRYDFGYMLDRIEQGQGVRSPLAEMIGSKGYHRDR